MNRLLFLLVLAGGLFLKPMPQQTGGSVTIQGVGLAIQIPPCFAKAYQNVPFNCVLVAQNGAGGYTWSKVSGGFPAGIADVTSAGVVAGTPTGTTAASEIVQLMDSAGTSVTMTVPIAPASLTGTGPCGIAICLTPTALSVQAGQTAANPVVATCYWSDGTSANSQNQPRSSCPVPFSSSNGSVATVNSSTGAVTGVAAGSANVSATFDSVTSNNAAVTVAGAAVTLTINQTAFPVNANGTANMQQFQPLPSVTGWTLTASCSGCTLPLSWSVTGGAFPTGVSINSSTATISGTPSTTATSVTIQVADSASHTATQTFSFIVATISSGTLSPLTPSVPVNANLQETCTANYSDSSTAPCPAGTPVVWSYVGGNVASAISSTTSVTVSNVPSGNITVCGAVNVNGGGTSQTLSTVQDSAAHSFMILGPTTFTNFVGQNWLAYFIGSITSPITLTWGAGSQQYDAGCDSFNVSAGTISADGAVASVSGATASNNISLPSFTPTGTDLLYGSVNPQQNLSSFNPPWTGAANMVTVSGAGNAYVLGASAATAMNAAQISQGTYNALIQGFKTNATNTGTVWSLSACPSGVTINATTGFISTGPQSGTCTLKATAPGSISATTTLTIQPPPDKSIVIQPASAALATNASVNFTAVGNSSLKPLTGVTWGLNPTGCGSLSSTTSNPTTYTAAPGACSTSIGATVSGLTGASAPITVTAPATAALLTGCTVSALNVPSCATPTGFTLADAEGFDSGALKSGESLFNGTNIECSFSHTGTCALQRLNNSGDQGTGMIVAGSLINGRETYLSWWEYVDAPMRLNLQMIETRRSIFTAGGTPLTDILWNWEDGSKLVVLTGCYNNCTDAQSSIYAEGTQASGLPNFSKYDGSYFLIMGSWVQYEVDLKTNDPGVSNGFLTVFRNGVQIQHIDSTTPGFLGNFNGSQDMALAQLEVGGFNEAFMYWNDSAHTQCTAAQTLGPFTTNNTNWGACSCSAQCPPNGQVPTFNRYIDDVIVLKK